jgi:DNA-binding NtrC family response regulator
MMSTLVVEANPELREIIVDVLRDEGFAATCTGNYDAALAALQVSPMPMIVLLGHGGRSVLSTRLLQHIAVLPGHGYVLVSTSAATAPCVWNPRTAGRVPILPAPFDIDDLASQVRTTAAELVEQAHRPPCSHNATIRSQHNTEQQGAAPTLTLEDLRASLMHPHDTAGEVSWHAHL